MPEHLPVVEHFDQAFRGARYRARCEACPWAASTATERHAYDLAERHVDWSEAHAQLRALEAS